MKISIFGLGYVGCVSAACLSNNNHNVIGVDIDKNKIDLINQGKPTIIEKDIEALVAAGRNQGLLEATANIDYAINNSDVSIICVGTPSSEEGFLNLEYIFKVASEIGKSLNNKTTFHVIAIRSTVPPGTNMKVANIIEKESGKKFNTDFAMVSNPEFLRESTAVEDYYNPSFTLIASDNEKALTIMEELYKDIKAPIYKANFAEAEIIKYINNAYHALKIVFGNEVGNICKNTGIDSHKVMDLFCKDKKLNISPYYFKPGFAYGGSCLPKDLKGLANFAKSLNVKTPVISSIEMSNDFQKELLLKNIIRFDKKKIGLLGLSFKAGTDDLRESPIVDVVERLIGKGYQVKIYDKNIELSRLIGKNKSYIENKLPHLSTLTTGLDDVVDDSEIIIIANKEDEFKQLVAPKENTVLANEVYCRNNHRPQNHSWTKDRLKNKIVIDLVRMDEIKDYCGEYHGICW